MARALADRFQIICRSTLASAKAARPSRQGYARLVIHYLHLLPALKVDRPHLVGHSMGGWMAAEIAAVATERFATSAARRPASIT